MTQNNQALKVVLAAAQQIPPKLQKQLAERLMKASTPDTNTVVVSLQRLSPQKQARLTKLMDKNTEGSAQPGGAVRTEAAGVRSGPDVAGEFPCLSPRPAPGAFLRARQADEAPLPTSSERVVFQAY